MKTKSIPFIGGKKTRVQKAIADNREELKSERLKVIPVDRGKTVKVERVAYPPELVEMVFHTLAHISAIRDAQFKLRGSEFYAAGMEREMDRASSIKLMPLFKQNDSGKMSDAVIRMSSLFSDMCQYSYQIALQPQHTQDRFEREYKDLLISCGVTLMK